MLCRRLHVLLSLKKRATEPVADAPRTKAAICSYYKIKGEDIRGGGSYGLWVRLHVVSLRISHLSQKIGCVLDTEKGIVQFIIDGLLWYSVSNTASHCNITGAVKDEFTQPIQGNGNVRLSPLVCIQVILSQHDSLTALTCAISRCQRSCSKSTSILSRCQTVARLPSSL